MFQLALGNTGVPLSLRAIKASYTTIIDSSDHAQPPVCTLTADERDSWALVSTLIITTFFSVTDFSCSLHNSSRRQVLMNGRGPVVAS